jgi:MFS transporter, DHA1 family, multidrug resistance protein
MTAAATTPERVDPRAGELAPAVVAAALALLLGLQPVVTDLYLPALPQIAAHFAAPMTATQLTMSALMLTFGISQLVWGPVADRFGRRPVLLSSLLLFVLASAGAALAPSIEALVAWRAVQGIGTAAAVVCARAMVRDLFEPHEGAHVMSQGLSGLGLIAISAPLAGGVLAAGLGWRSALAAVALAGIAALLFVWRALPETARVLDPHATRLGPLLRTAGRVLRHRTFIAYAALTAASYGGLFTILASSSFVYIRVLGLTPARYGVVMATGSMAYLAGTFLCRRWLKGWGMTGTAGRGGLFSLAGGLSMAAFAALGVHQVWAVLVPHCVFCFAHGIVQPCGQAGSVGPFPQAAGVAAALAGFVLAAIAFVIGLWIGATLGDTVHPMAYGVGFWSLMTCTVAWTLVRRHGAPPHPAQA